MLLRSPGRTRTRTASLLLLFLVAGIGFYFYSFALRSVRDDEYTDSSFVEVEVEDVAVASDPETETRRGPVPPAMVLDTCGASDPLWPPSGDVVPNFEFFGPYMNQSGLDCSHLSICSRTAWFDCDDGADVHAEGGVEVDRRQCMAKVYPGQDHVRGHIQPSNTYEYRNVRYILRNTLLRRTFPADFEMVCDRTPFCAHGDFDCGSFLAGTRGYEDNLEAHVTCVDQYDVSKAMLLPERKIEMVGLGLMEGAPVSVKDIPTYFYNSGGEWNIWHMYTEGYSLFATMWEDGHICLDHALPGSRSGAVAKVSPVRVLRNPFDRPDLKTPDAPEAYKRLVSPLIAEEVVLEKGGQYHIPGEIGVGLSVINNGAMNVFTNRESGKRYLTRSRYERQVEKTVVPHYRDFIGHVHGLKWKCGDGAAGVGYGTNPPCSIVVSIRGSGGNGKLWYPDDSVVTMWVMEARKQYPACTIEAVDFAKLSFPKQLALVHRTSVIIGVSGASHTLIMWMCPGTSAVIDVYPIEVIVDNVVMNVYPIIADTAGVDFYRMYRASVDGDMRYIPFEADRINTVLKAALKRIGLGSIVSDNDGGDDSEFDPACYDDNEHWVGAVDLCHAPGAIRRYTHGTDPGSVSVIFLRNGWWIYAMLGISLVGLWYFVCMPVWGTSARDERRRNR